MSQINKISNFKIYQFKVGDKVTCEFFPDTIWTIIEINGKTALIRSQVNSERHVNVRRLRKA